MKKIKWKIAAFVAWVVITLMVGSVFGSNKLFNIQK